MAKTICWECGRNRECKPRTRANMIVEYLCRDCAAEVDKGAK